MAPGQPSESAGHEHALREDALPAPDFQKSVVSALRDAGAPATSRAPFRLTVEGPSGLPLQVRLDGFFKAYRHGEVEVDGVVAEIAAAAGVSAARLAAVGPVPILVRRAELALPPGAVLRPCDFADELAITYVRSLPHGDLPVRVEEVAERWPMVDDLHALALANLATATKAAEVTVSGAGATLSVGYATGDGLDAARALLPGVLAELAGWLEPPVVVALPCRDLLLVFSALDADYVAAAREHVAHTYAANADPLTDRLFALAASGTLEPFAK